MEQAKEYYQKWCEVPQPRKIKAMKLIAFVCYFLFLFLLVIYAFGRTGKKTSLIIPLVVFTDGTPYNLQIIRYLAQRRDVILSMVIVASNYVATTQLQASTTAVSDLVQQLKSDGLATHVPAVYGAYNDTDNNFLEALQKQLATSTTNFLVVGPCTDAAYFLQQYAGSRGNINRVYVAGGAFNVAGNAVYLNSSNTVAERNFYLDGTAADYVLAGAHGRPVVLLPLDATLTWTDAAYAAIVSKPASAAASAATVGTALTAYYADVDKTKRVTVGMAAAAYAADLSVRSGIVITVIPVRVYTSTSDARYGGSYRPQSSSDQKGVTVVMSSVSSTFFTHLINVNSLALV